MTGDGVSEPRRVLITGAAGGLGQALAASFARQGYTLVLTDRPDTPMPEPLRRTLDADGTAWTWLSQDLADLGGLTEFVDRIWEQAGPLDVLVNNAGVAQLQRFNEVTQDSWRAAMTVDLDAPFFLSQRVAEHLIHEGRTGRIVMITSKNGLQAEPGLAPYNAAKGGLELLMQSLAVELGPYGITVNSVAPGMIETSFAADFPLDWDAFVDYYDEHIPLQHRFAQVDEIVAPVVFLASLEASYITGHSLVVDGGVLANQVPREQFMRPYLDGLAAPDA